MKIFSIKRSEQFTDFTNISVFVRCQNEMKKICFAFYFDEDTVDTIIKEFQELFQSDLSSERRLLKRSLTALTKKNSRFHTISFA